ncbi:MULTISPECIES: MinD/ParA family protein [unclassified Microbacterium]|uniref:MinD/ParA family ATP-binding protein n=1 Tax=unclassified Microbacterium TaxID=2609290 RepID=UPI001E4B975A|nr:MULTISPECIES: MinD/ParA family protein [unclassified Microbacterium]
MPSVETSGIGLLGTQTAHVNITLPAEEEDDEDIVEGDIAFAGGFVTIDLPAVEQQAPTDEVADDVAIEEAAVEVSAEGDDSTEDLDGVVPDEASVEDMPLEAGAMEDSPIEDSPIEHSPSEDSPSEDSRIEDGFPEDIPLGAGSEDLTTEDASFEDVDIDDLPLDDAETTGFEPTGFESAPAAPHGDAATDDDLDAPVDDAPDEKETPVNDGTAPASQPAERREVARTSAADAPVLASRRIGDIAGVSERETSDLLTADRLLDPAQIARPEPEGVWQHLLYSVTGGKLNVGDGKRARARKALDRRIAAALPGGGARFVAVVSRKGGVGKTTITTLLGQALADARDDRVIAVDANPDRGTLAERIARRSGRTVRDLVRERDNLRGYNDVSAIVARDETRLDVLASDTDPHIAEAFSGDEYRAVAEVAAHYYSVVLTDTGTGIVHSVMGATLERADRLIVVAGRSIDEARLASETLTWLEANGYEDRVRSAIVVLNMSSPGTSPVRQDELEAHFRTRVRDVLRMPYDPQLATGGAIVFRDLQPATRAAARELAAKVVEGLQSVSTAA